MTIKCKYCEKPAIRKVVWLKDKQGNPASIRVPHCGCDLMAALRKFWANPYPVKEGVDYDVEPLSVSPPSPKVSVASLSEAWRKWQREAEGPIAARDTSDPQLLAGCYLDWSGGDVERAIRTVERACAKLRHPGCDETLEFLRTLAYPSVIRAS